MYGIARRRGCRLQFSHRIAPLCALLAACADQGALAPEYPSEGPLYSVGAAIDLTGEWQWTETTLMSVRAWAVPIFFGIAPEGPITHITCETAGTSSITQNGPLFSGSMVQTGTCVTAKGKTAVAPFPSPLDIVNGEVRGRGFRFSYDEPTIPGIGPVLCNYQGAIKLLAGQAEQLQGRGDCRFPGRTEQEFGHEMVVHFVAHRVTP